MRLVHYSKTPLLVVESRSQTILNAEPTFRPKPTGLWVSDENDFGWAEWCSTDMPEWLEGTHPYEIELASTAKILHLATEQDVINFGNEYLVEVNGIPRRFGYKLDWDRVADQYQGIIITPYQWNLRLDPQVSWYYTWDCASGCIWDASAVASINAVPHVIEEAPA